MRAMILNGTISSILSFIVNLTFFFIPIYLKQLGFTGTQIGVLFAILMGTALLSSINFGMLTDRLTIRSLMIAGTILLSLFYFSLSELTTFPLLALTFLIGGLGNNLLRISIISLTYKKVTNHKVGKQFGVFRSISYIGMAAGMFLGGILLDSIDFPLVFKISAIAPISLLVLILFVERNKKYKSNIQEYKQDLWKPDIILFAIVIFFFATHFGAELTSYSLFLKENLNLNLIQTGIYMGIAVISLGIANLAFGKLWDKGMKFRHFMSTGLIISGLGHILMVNENYGISLFFRAFHEIGDAAIFLFLMLGIYKYFPKQRVGGTSAVIATVMILGNAVGALIYGPIGPAFGYHMPLIASGMVSILLLITLKIAEKAKLIKPI